MEISNHAKKRLKERAGCNKKNCEKLAAKAFVEGISHSQTKGRLNKWVTSLFYRNKNANNIRLYRGMAYIFCGEILVTVIHIPQSLMKDFKKMVRRDN